MRQLTDSYGGLRQNWDARYPQGTSGFQRLLLLPLMRRTGTLKQRLCVPVRFTGENFRQETAQRKMESMKKLITD